MTGASDVTTDRIHNQFSCQNKLKQLAKTRTDIPDFAPALYFIASWGRRSRADVHFAREKKWTAKLGYSRRQ
jgi:hypothetical protein